MAAAAAGLVVRPEAATVQRCRAGSHGALADAIHREGQRAHRNTFPHEHDRGSLERRHAAGRRQDLTRSSRFLGLGGLVAIAFGIVLLVWPGLSLVALTALFGAFARVYGVLGLAAGLNLLAHRSTDWVPFVLGGLAGIAIGAGTFFWPSSG